MVAHTIHINDGSIDPSLNYPPTREQEADYARRQMTDRLRLVSLNAIEWSAGNVQRDAEALSHHVKILDGLPGFETRAEAAVDDAEAALTAALRIVMIARKSLAKKRLT